MGNLSAMFQGWKITGATIVTQAAQAGMLVYGFSALALPLELEFGTTRTEVMIATTCLSLASSALAPVAGWAIDRNSVRKLMLFGAAMLGIGFAVLSIASRIWHVWLVYALMLAPANVLLGQLTSSALVTRWFAARRGRAMGLSTLGTSLGGFIFPLLIASGSAWLGWRAAAAAVGLTAAAIAALVVALTVVDTPALAGVAIDEGRVAHHPEPVGPALSTREILSRPAFWIITFAVGIKIATYFGLINNLAPYARTMGVDSIVAASLISVLSVTSMAGKLGFGLIAERVLLKWLFAGALVLTIASFGLLLVATGYATLLVACLMLGLATGGMLPMWGLVVAQQFGQASYGRALGLTNLVMVPLTASASPVAGWVYDRTGSYHGVIVGSMAVLSLAVLLIAALRAPQGHAAS